MNALRLVTLSAFMFLARPALAVDPTKSQCLSSNGSAQSLRASGKLREARAQLLTCAAKTCPRPVRRDCAEWLTEVDKAMPTIVFDVKDGGGNDLTAVVVELDAVVLVIQLDGTAIPVDPGQHVFRFSSEGLPTIDKTFVIQEGEKDRHEKIVLGAAPATASPKSDVETPSSSGDTQRTAGLVIGGAGVVGLGIGAVLGIMAQGAWAGSQHQCPGACSALTEANVATVGFIAGGALLAGGAVLYLTAPRVGVSVAPRIGGADVRLGVTW